MPPKRKAAANSSTKKSDNSSPKLAKMDNSTSDDCVWEEVEKSGKFPAMFCLYSTKLEGRDKVVGFDIDWTVIATASGKKFATGANDWKFLYDIVPDKLREVHKDGYRVIFVSNQGGVEKGKATINEIKTKVAAIIKQLGIPVYAFFSTGENQYRKPSTEMWDYFENHCNNGVKVDKSQSIYVGDAAGRAKDWAPGKPKDFSCTDRMFAANIGVDFQTPEQFFLEEKPAPFQWGSFDAKEFLRKTADESGGANKSYHSSSQEVVLFMGMPACGKSTFYRKYFEPHGYVHCNKDTLKTPAKCFKVADESLKSGKSIVVDNTHPSKAARAEYVELAKTYNVPIRCFHFDIDRDLANHLNYLRQNMTNGQVRRIPDVGYNMFKSKFEAPTTGEGFSVVEKVGFVPEFKEGRHRALFEQWTA